MSGLLRRMRRVRGSGSEQDADEQRTTEQPSPNTAPEAGSPALPAGTDLDALVGAPPDSRRRSKLRRRLRHLRSVREVLLRDLGGFVFELHRSPGEQTETETELVAAKLVRIDRVDYELRELEGELDDRRRGLVVREPGIGGTCAVCGELFGSEARFCWACGTPVAPGAVRPVSAVAQAATGAAGVQLPQLAPGGPDPASQPADIEGTGIEVSTTAGPEPSEDTALHPSAAGTAGPREETVQYDRPAPAPQPSDGRPVPPADVWERDPDAGPDTDGTQEANSATKPSLWRDPPQPS